jgi:glycosyltransferase involved in cell wall biosynthesis
LRANVLLYVGQVIPRKGVELFLENVCTISVDVLSTLSIVVIGGQLDEKLKLRLEKQGLHLINIGFVQPRNLAEYYGMADAFVFPTLEDEWGVVINEATAAGLPVLGSQFSGAVTDLVHNGENGYVFDPTNKAEVMRTIERFLRLSPAEKEAFGNRSFVLGQRFDVEHTVANLEFAFRKSLEGRHGIGQDRNVTDGSDGGMLTGP